MSDQPAPEGAEITPSAPEQPEAAPEGMVNVQCTVPNVHLGGDQKLLEGEIGAVTAELAAMLEEKGMARRV